FGAVRTTGVAARRLPRVRTETFAVHADCSGRTTNELIRRRGDRTDLLAFRTGALSIPANLARRTADRSSGGSADALVAAAASVDAGRTLRTAGDAVI